MVNRIGDIALQGIQRSTQGMVRSAEAVARAGRTGAQDQMTRALVELKQHEHAAKANIKTLQSADRVLGSLLDVKA